MQDKSKALKDDEAKITHWSDMHDQLQLHEIEYV